LLVAPALAQAVGQPVSELRQVFDHLTDLSVFLNVAFGMLALVVPPLSLKKGREAAARAAAWLTAASGVTAAAVIVFLKLAAIPDTGNCLLLVIPATLIALVSGVIWVVVGYMKAGR
jgi:hypothetical protein